jgi:hypothetical protein
MTRRRKPLEAALHERVASHRQALMERVAAEYGVAADSDQADHIATLIVLRRAIRDRAWRGDVLRTDPDDMVKIDATLREYQRKDDGLRVELHYVEGVTGVATITCPCGCGHTWQHEFASGTYTPFERPKPPAPVAEPAPVVVAPPPAKDNVVDITRNLHYGSEGFTGMGAIYAPSVGNTAAGLPFNDPNPTRRF